MTKESDATQGSEGADTPKKTGILTRFAEHRKAIAFLSISALAGVDRWLDFDTKKQLADALRQQNQQIVTMQHEAHQAQQNIANLETGLAAVLDANAVVLAALNQANRANAGTAGGASRDAVAAIQRAQAAQTQANAALAEARRRSGGTAE